MKEGKKGGCAGEKSAIFLECFFSSLHVFVSLSVYLLFLWEVEAQRPQDNPLEVCPSMFPSLHYQMPQKALKHRVPEETHR